MNVKQPVLWAALLSMALLALIGCTSNAAPESSVDIPDPPAVSGSNEAADAPADADLDQTLRAVLAANGIDPLDPGPTPPAAKVALGEALFFDKELSGNRDIACATCHHPSFGIGDGLSLAIGTRGVGLGTARQIGADREFVPRNAPELFNRGAVGWQALLWDARLSLDDAHEIAPPAGDLVPDDIDGLLASQAMFPVISREEMRGVEGDVDVYGQPNELAVIADDNIPAVWAALTARLLAIPEYRAMFAAAYPNIPTDGLGFQHAANAIAAYETATFTLRDSPWDRYLAGDDSALSDQAKEGALLFYGEAGCAACHSGDLMTDQLTHNMAVPQMGPGKNEENVDRGSFNQTENEADQFAFRTPPLRNVAITAPYMHNGAFVTVEAAVRHMLDPAASLRTYDNGQININLRQAHPVNTSLNDALLRGLDPLAQPVSLSDMEFDRLMAFLRSLTSPTALNLYTVIPDAVPSGLPVEDGLPTAADAGGTASDDDTPPPDDPDDAPPPPPDDDNNDEGGGGGRGGRGDRNGGGNGGRRGDRDGNRPPPPGGGDRPPDP